MSQFEWRVVANSGLSASKQVTRVSGRCRAFRVVAGLIPETEPCCSMMPDTAPHAPGSTMEPASLPLWRIFPPILLPIFLAVVDGTIVASALPAMAGAFGEVERVSWVVASYLVASTVAAPVYGRLAACRT